VFKIIHQNIRGLRNKCNEILCHLKEQTPHVLCFTEHHLEGNEVVHLNLDNYILGAYYNRKHFKIGGTCIYVHNSLKIAAINLDNYCYDKDIEACYS
jgi:exonuclease III